MAAYDLDDFRAALSVQLGFWAFGVAQILRYRRKALDHLRRVHPGAIESMRAGVPFVHPGIGDRRGRVTRVQEVDAPVVEQRADRATESRPHLGSAHGESAIDPSVAAERHGLRGVRGGRRLVGAPAPVRQRAATSAVATPRRRSMRRGTSPRPATRSSRASSPARTGSGTTRATVARRGPALAPPTSRPAEQEPPAPRERVPANWQRPAQLNPGTCQPRCRPRSWRRRAARRLSRPLGCPDRGQHVVGTLAGGPARTRAGPGRRSVGRRRGG